MAPNNTSGQGDERPHSKWKVSNGCDVTGFFFVPRSLTTISVYDKFGLKFVPALRMPGSINCIVHRSIFDRVPTSSIQVKKTRRAIHSPYPNDERLLNIIGEATIDFVLNGEGDDKTFHHVTKALVTTADLSSGGAKSDDGTEVLMWAGVGTGSADLFQYDKENPGMVVAYKGWGKEYSWRGQVLAYTEEPTGLPFS